MIVINTSFINLISDDNIKKINIDSRLVEPFKNVIIKLQKYFNEYNLTDAFNYEEMFNKYMLSSDILDKDKIILSTEFKDFYNKRKKDREKVNEYFKKIGKSISTDLNIDDVYVDFLSSKGILSIIVKDINTNGTYKDSINSIIINEKCLNNEDLEKTLCHEFIHYLTICGQEQYGDIRNNLPMFAVEALTEMLSQEIFYNKNNKARYISYLEWCELMDFINDYYGIKDYRTFLKRDKDLRYENILEVIDEIANAFFIDLDVSKRDLSNYDKMKIQDELINYIGDNLLLEQNLSLEEFVNKILFFNKLPFSENKENIKRAKDIIIESFASLKKINVNKIKELIKIEEQLQKYDGKDVYEFQDKEDIYAFTSDGMVYKDFKNAGKPFLIDEDYIYYPYFLDKTDNTITFFNYNNAVKTFKLDKIDFFQRKRELLNQKELLLNGKKELVQERNDNMESKEIQMLKERLKKVHEKQIALLKEFREKYPDEKAYPNIEYDGYYASKDEELFEIEKEIREKIEKLQKIELRKHNEEVEAERNMIKTIQSLFPNIEINEYNKVFNPDGNGLTYYLKSESQLLNEKQKLQNDLNNLNLSLNQKQIINQNIETIYNKYINKSQKTKNDVPTSITNEDLDAFIEEMELINASKETKENEEDMGMSM